MVAAKRVRRYGLEPNEACHDDHDLAVWFTPEAIIDAEPRLITREVTKDALERAARELIDNDRLLWEDFHRLARNIIARAKAQKGGP